jgi:leucyl aminopeptidase (aminopeptidase T)
VPAAATAGTRPDSSGQDLRAVAANLVKAGMVRRGDKVLISGSARDAALMEDAAIEVMKAGGHPVMVLASERLQRRSYDEVPAAYDSVAPAAELALFNAFDVLIPIDVGEAEGLLADVPQARRTARAKAGDPVFQTLLRRSIRTVNLGNGVYPTPTLARRLGVPEADLRAAFWEAARVPPETLRARGEAVRAKLVNARQLTLSHANGTNLTFGVDVARGFISDGAITPEKVKQGSAAASTWLPAGELILPARPGTAEGTVVVDRMLWDGEEVRGLTLSFSKGRLTSMTAASGVDRVKAAYDAAGGAKDQFGFVDIGLNPAMKLPVDRGRLIWVAPGSVVVGLGDNRGFGGTNASDFGLPAQIGGATLKADGAVVIENGALPR